MSDTNIPEIFGSMVYNQQVMKQTLSPEVYDELTRTMENGTPLNIEVANQIAESMKNWAI